MVVLSGVAEVASETDVARVAVLVAMAAVVGGVALSGARDRVGMGGMWWLCW